MFLICTIKGTVRLMSTDKMYLEDLDIGICNVYKLLTKQQQEDIYLEAKTKITDTQEDKIRKVAGQ